MADDVNEIVVRTGGLFELIAQVGRCRVMAIHTRCRVMDIHTESLQTIEHKNAALVKLNDQVFMAS